MGLIEISFIEFPHRFIENRLFAHTLDKQFTSQIMIIFNFQQILNKLPPLTENNFAMNF